MKKALYIFIGVIILGASILIWSNSQEGKNPQLPPEQASVTELNIGYSRLRISLPVFVAQEKGIFEKHGIKANLLMYETAQPLMQALIEGKVDVAGYTALPITFNGMLRSKKELYFISTMVEDDQHRVSYLLVNSGDNNIKTVKDLKGKKIGILPTIAYMAWIEEILEANQVDPYDVVIQQISPMQQVQALQSGGVDALFTNDPAATAALVSGVAKLLSDEVESPEYIVDPFPFGSFNVSKQWADQNPDLYDSLVASIDEAIEFVNQYPDQSKHLMKKYMPATFKEHVNAYPDARYLDSKETDEPLYENLVDLYEEMGIIKEDLSVEGLVE